MSSSQRKKERRRMRYERNVRKEIEHKNQAWAEGKLIEENHNQGPYSAQYTIALSERLVQYVNQERDKALNMEPGSFIDKRTQEPLSKDEVYVRGFRKYKMKIQDLILYWNPEVPRNRDYEYLKNLIVNKKLYVKEGQSWYTEIGGIKKSKVNGKNALYEFIAEHMAELRQKLFEDGHYDLLNFDKVSEEDTKVAEVED